MARPQGNASRPRGRVLESLFLPLVLAVMVGSAWYATRPREAEPALTLPDFSLPGIELDVGFSVELPGRFAPMRRAEAPQLALGHDTERVIAEVREVLLVSSARTGDDVASPEPALEGSPEQVAAR